MNPLNTLIALALIVAVAGGPMAGCEVDSSWTDEDEAALVYLCVDVNSDIESLDSCGTGFFVSDRQIVTANHVIKNRLKTSDTWRFWRGPNMNRFLTDIPAVRVDKDNDIAILTFSIALNETWFDLCDRDPELGDPIIIPGYKRSVLDLAEGWVVRTNFLQRWLKVSADSAHGASGAPMLDATDLCVSGLTKSEVPRNFSKGHYTAGPSVSAIVSLLHGGASGAGSSDVHYQIK